MKHPIFSRKVIPPPLPALSCLRVQPQCDRSMGGWFSGVGLLLEEIRLGEYPIDWHATSMPPFRDRVGTCWFSLRGTCRQTGRVRYKPPSANVASFFFGFCHASQSFFLFFLFMVRQQASPVFLSLFDLLGSLGLWQTPTFLLDKFQETVKVALFLIQSRTKT